MPINMQRLSQFLANLQDASQQALQRGDVGASKAYADLIRQAEKQLMPVISQQQAVQASGQQPPAPMGPAPVPQAPAPAPAPTPQGGAQGATALEAFDNANIKPFPTVSPYIPPADRGTPQQNAQASGLTLNNNPGNPAQALMQDAKQETSPSWVDLVFPQGWKSPLSTDWWMTSMVTHPGQKEPNKPVYPTDVARAAGEIRPSDVGKGVSSLTDKDALLTALIGPVAANAPTVAGNIAADEPLKNWLNKPEAPYRGPTSLNEHEFYAQQTPPSALELWKNDTTGNTEYPGATAEEIAAAEKAGGGAPGPTGTPTPNPGATPAIPTPNGGVTAAKGSGNWGLADLFGILFGGRQFLRYKAQQEAMREGREFQADRDEAAKVERRHEIEQQMAMQEQRLAVEYAKNQAIDQRRAENEDAAFERAMMRAVTTPGADVNNPLMKDYANRAKAIQLKKNKN
jgi:hypothetical protein